jgi:hypothetical protein
LTAPVRLRSVASGLMIEKVRSVAMIFVLKERMIGSCRAYIGAIGQRQATLRRSARAAQALRQLRQFHEAEPFLKAVCHFHSAGRP